MKMFFSANAVGMVWVTFPLMVGLYYWEHTLQLLAMDHKIIQILLVFVVFGWAYFWSLQAEYYRLRHLFDTDAPKTVMRYHLICDSSYEAIISLSDKGFSSKSESLPEDERASRYLNM